MTRLGVALALGGMGWAIPFGASIVVLLPVKIAAIDPVHKVAVLAVLTIAGSIVALLANIAFGALSDLTCSRFGRRNPWVVGGGVAGAVLLVLLATAQTIPLLIVWWCLYQAAQNAIVMALAAWIPDRVPSERRGTVSAVSSLGLLFGVAAGAVVGARFIKDPGAGFSILAVVFVVLPIICVLLGPDFSSQDQDRRKLAAGAVFASLVFPWQGAADFYWALVGRLLIVLGYHLVNGYQLYILTDYMKLDETAAAKLVSLVAITGLCASLAGNTIAGPLSDKLRRRKVIVIAASVLIGLGAVVPLFAPLPWTMLVFAGVAGLGLGVYFSVDVALMSEVLPKESARAKDLGILSMANTGGQIIAPGVSSLVVGLGFGFAPIFLITLGLCFLGALAILPIKKVR